MRKLQEFTLPPQTFLEENTARSLLRGTFVGLDRGWIEWTTEHDEAFRSKLALINARLARQQAHPLVAAHYASQWLSLRGYDPLHALHCPACYTVVHDLTRETAAEPLFRNVFFGAEKFRWHYEVQWEQNDTPINYSLDREGRLTFPDEKGLAPVSCGWTYQHGSRLTAIRHSGMAAIRIRPTRYDRNGSRSIPNWLRLTTKL